MLQSGIVPWFLFQFLACSYVTLMRSITASSGVDTLLLTLHDLLFALPLDIAPVLLCMSYLL